MAQNTVYLWEQRADYIEACRTVMQFVDPLQYTPPRRQGVDAGDVTDFQVGQARWSVNNLPEILYQLESDDDWQDFKRKPVQDKTDASGNVMLEQWPEPGQARRRLRDFPVLANINQICTQEHPLIIEAWRRLDPRIRWPDITMRMQRYGRPNHNALNQNTQRTFRSSCITFPWHGKGDIRSSRTNQNVLNALTPAQIAAITTRGSTPGLVDQRQPFGPSVPLPALEPDEGLTRRRAIPEGHVGLNRTIGRVGGQPAAGPQGAGGNAATTSQSTTSRTSSAPALASASATAGSGLIPAEELADDSPSEIDTDASEMSSDEGSDEGSDYKPPPRSSRTRPTRRTTQRPRRQPLPSPEPSYAGETSLQNANQFLVEQNRSPLQSDGRSRQQRREDERRAASRPQAPSPRPASRTSARGRVEGYRYRTEIFRYLNRGVDPFSPPNPTAPTASTGPWSRRPGNENRQRSRSRSPSQPPKIRKP